MDWRSFIQLTDSWKLFTFDVEPAHEVETLTWTQDGTHATCWSTPYTDGVPNRVTEDGNEYMEALSLFECSQNSSSFYYDFQNQVLYLHTSNSDSPGKLSAGLPVYTILVFFYRHFSNAAFEDDPVVFPRITKAIYNGDFETWYDDLQPYDWYTGEDGSSTVRVETSDVHSGAYAVRIDIDGNNAAAYIYKNPLRLAPGAHCKLTVWYKNSEAGKFAAVELVDVQGNTYLQNDGSWALGAGVGFDLPNVTEWTKYVLEFDAPATYIDYYLFVGNGSDATESSIYIDSVQLDVFREENPYLPLASNSMPDLNQSIQLFHLGTVTMEAGTAEFVNDGWWYEQLKKYWWHSKNIVIKMGAKGSTYDEMEQVFAGLVADISANEAVAKLELVDNKFLTYSNVNPNNFWTSDYTWLEDGAEGKPIPIIYGEFAEVIPTCINISSSPSNRKAPWTYKVADHELEDIPSVWKNGVLLILNNDYTLDLANGEFTLLANPYATFITCSIKGKKCARFRALITGTYSENVADILYDMLLDYGGFDPETIDVESLLDLKTFRTQKHHLYIAQDTPIYNIIRMLQASALFHFIPLTDGRFGAFRFKTGTDANTIQIRDEDIEGFGIQYDTESVYKTIRLSYGYKPSESNFSEYDVTNDKIEWRHGRKDTLAIQTSLRGFGTDVADLAAYYSAVLQDPIKMFVGTLPSVVFASRPGEKIIVTKTKKLDDGSSYSVFNQDPYRLISLRKKIQNGKVEIEAWDDLQSAGEQFCEICNSCQVCYTTEHGGSPCTVCYACQNCDSGQCALCQACYYCEHCDAGQCSSCQNCDSCQTCNSCQIAVGNVCPTCEKCNTGQCASCQHCNSCQHCYTCQRGDSCGKLG